MMPKFNPKRKGRSQQPESPPPGTTEKKSGTYKRGTPNRTKFYGIVIIAAIATGLVMLLTTDLFATSTIKQWDHVQLHLTIWIWPTNDDWNETLPADYSNTQWYNFTTIYENSTDSNASVYKSGLPIRLYEEVRNYKVGFGRTIKIDNCTDANRDGYDDTTGLPALGWGFPVPGFENFAKKTVVVRFEVLAIDPHT